MAKYLFQGNYAAEGARGLLKEGGSSRRAVIEKMFQAAGGRVEAFYYAFGETDVYVIGELPDNASATALALTIASSGVVAAKTTVLLSAEEVDQAAKKKVEYRAPGK